MFSRHCARGSQNFGFLIDCQCGNSRLLNGSLRGHRSLSGAKLQQASLGQQGGKTQELIPLKGDCCRWLLENKAFTKDNWSLKLFLFDSLALVWLCLKQGEKKRHDVSKFQNRFYDQRIGIIWPDTALRGLWPLDLCICQANKVELLDVTLVCKDGWIRLWQTDLRTRCLKPPFQTFRWCFRRWVWAKKVCCMLISASTRHNRAISQRRSNSTKIPPNFPSHFLLSFLW